MKYCKYYLIIFAFCLTSCYKDIDNVSIEGIITDTQTDKPIENVKVSIICWSYGNSPDGSYTGQDSVTVITNKNGKYIHNFKKGAFVEVKTSVSGYINELESTEVSTKKNVIDLKLKPN